LSSGVMVALRILVPPVRVRVLPGQQKRECFKMIHSLFFL
jgi:hypothetical protein